MTRTEKARSRTLECVELLRHTADLAEIASAADARLPQAVRYLDATCRDVRAHIKAIHSQLRRAA